MSNWVIHVGPGKTGTTFLQNAVFGRCERIHAAGRPNNRRPEYQDFHHAVTSEEDDEKARNCIASFVAEEESRAGNRSIVLSDETFALAPAWTVVARRINEAIPNAKVLFTIRNQPGAVISYYSNHGRSLSEAPMPYRGRFVSFDNWFDYAVREGHCRFVEAIDYRKLVQPFERSFPGMVHVLLYETMLQDRSCFGAELSHVLGTDVVSLVEASTRINPRQSQRAMRYQRWRSKLLPNVHLTNILPWGQSLRSVAERFLKRGAAIELTLTSEHKATIGARFAESNEWMQRRYQLPLERHGYPLPTVRHC